MDLKKFGEQLKRLRQQARLSQEEFIDALDQLAQAGPSEDYRVIDGPLVSRWEHASSHKGRHWKPTRPYMLYLIRLFVYQLDLLTAQQWAAQAGYQFNLAELQDLFSGQVAVADWGESPDLGSFYGREREQETLERWLVVDRCRLVAIVGMGGVGKTALAARLVEQIASHFDRVLWRTLLNAPPLSELLQGCLQALSDQKVAVLPPSLDEQLELLLAHLRRRHCLVVFDNFESILQAGDRAGLYRPGYADYGQLLQRIGQSHHQSCLLLTSRERPLELARLETGNLPGAVRSFHLSGLAEEAGREILQGYDLAGLNEETALVERYSGNPLALKLVAETIQELYGGNISLFLRQETLIFDDIRDVLDQQLARLSALERELLFWLVIEREPVSIEILQHNLAQPQPHWIVLEAVRALQRRSLLERSQGGFTLQNVVIEYLTDRLVEAICQELEAEAPASLTPGSRGEQVSPLSLHFPTPPSTGSGRDLLNRYALLKAQAKEYIRQSQVRLILEPIARRLVANLGLARVAAVCRRLLACLQETPRTPGYAAGNILNLLLHLGCDMRGYDFSRLCVWQAYLRGISLPEVNFAQADLTGSIFTSTFPSVHAIAFSPDGRLLATGTGNGTIYLWQASDGQPSGFLIGHTSFVWAIAFSPDSRLLASASEDHTIRVWDIQKRQSLHLVQGAGGWDWAVAFSPDGTTLATTQGDQIIRLWDIHTMQVRRTLSGHSSWVRSLAFSPDGRMIASGSHDQTIRLWDVQTGQTVYTLSGHSGWVRMVAFSLDGEMIASASDDGTVRLWAAQAGQVVQVLSGHTDRVVSVAFSPDGTILASGGEDLTIWLWNIHTRQPRAILSGHTQDVRCLAFSPDGAILASGSWDQTVRLWEVRTGQIHTILRGYNNWARAMVFCPDDRLLAGSIVDQTIRLWEVRSGRTCHILRGHIASIAYVAFSSDGAVVATSGWGQNVRLWDTQTGQPLQTLRGHTDVVTNLAFSPDSVLVASGSNDWTIRVWDVRTGQVIQILSGHSEAVRAIAFSPDKATVISAGADQTVRVWDLGSGQPRHILRGHTNIVPSVAFSPKGELVASGSYDWTVRVWDVHKGQVRHILSGHTSSVNPLSFNPEGTVLASGSDDQTVRLWDVHSGQVRHILRGHTGWVRSLTFSPDGATLASSSDDETIKLWDVGGGTCLDTFRAEGPYSGLNINGATGISEAQRAALRALGAIEQMD